MYQLDRVVKHLIRLDMAISRNAMEKAVEVKRPVALVQAPCKRYARCGLSP